MAHSALIISRYFLSLQDEEAGDLMSNLKLQKLLYYAQGYYVALNGVDTPLFRDTLYAWKHGPVVQTVYNHFAKHEANAIPVCQRPVLPGQTREFLDEIYRVYGRFSAWALRDMTHRETPWLKNYKEGVRNIHIPVQDLNEFFSKNVKKQKQS